MAKILEKHQLTPNLQIHKQSNCYNWIARLKIKNVYLSRSTKTRDLPEAIAKAHRLLIEYEIRFETNNFVIESKRFSYIAEKVIHQMRVAMATGTGKVIYDDYIGALNKYHIPFFGDTHITRIDADQLDDFDVWRVKELGRIPAKSTIQNHNSAMQMVFDFAVKRKYMLISQVPTLENKGASGSRRAAFTVDEYARVREQVVQMAKEGRREKTRQLRELLIDYMDFAILTGMRPGSEMDNLTWADLHPERDDSQIRFYVTVRKGKTTKYTGTREIVCKAAIAKVLNRLSDRFPDRVGTEQLFRLSDGSTSKEMNRHFDNALELIELKNSQYGQRSLYSLRHSYITWELAAQNVSIDVLARQCGTGIQMIEQHYSHVIPRMFGRQLSGIELETKERVVRQFEDVTYDQQLRQRMDEWAYNYKHRGYI
jgi:integrase